MGEILTLEELKGETSAYLDFTTIDDALMPQYYRDMLPHKCQCGADVIVSGDLTQPQCCNPCCWIKQAHRFAYFCQALGYKDVGSATALSLFSETKNLFDADTFLAAFRIEDAMVIRACGSAFCDTRNYIRDDLQHRALMFPDAINALGIPNIGLRSKLFQVVKKPEVFVGALLQGKTDEMCQAAGISAPQTLFALKQSIVDVCYLVRHIAPHIIAEPANEVNVMITGSVSVNGKPYTREEFVNLCESIRDANGNRVYKIKQTKARSVVEYAIADAPSSSSKYKLGKELNILITANEFYSLLKQRVGGSESNGSAGAECAVQ